MIRNWANWRWLSGDHIVEQHIHNIDVISWFAGMLPSKAQGVGSRQRRITGDQYDNFSISYTYDSGVNLHSMCRQMNGCHYDVSELVVGTKGSTNCQNTIWDDKGNIIWQYDYQKYVPSAVEGSNQLKVDAYDQEMIDLVAAIRNNTPYNEAEGAAESTMVAIMGREAAYTGREITFEEMMNSDLKIGPSEVKMGTVNYKAVVPVPGTGN
jgi:predicted dehydrogenase